jgi:site-specific DNA recombinase
LKGERQRNRKLAMRINKTGHHRSVDAPPEMLLTRFCPHLIFIEPERYDRVIRFLLKKNEGYARGLRANTPDSRKGISKKRALWPGQHTKCGICQR